MAAPVLCGFFPGEKKKKKKKKQKVKNDIYRKIGIGTLGGLAIFGAYSMYDRMTTLNVNVSLR